MSAKDVVIKVRFDRRDWARMAVGGRSSHVFES